MWRRKMMPFGQKDFKMYDAEGVWTLQGVFIIPYRWPRLILLPYKIDISLMHVIPFLLFSFMELQQELIDLLLIYDWLSTYKSILEISIWMSSEFSQSCFLPAAYMTLSDLQ